jgi:hypothetical protein
MSHKHGTYLGGVWSVAALRDRCRINDVTGCWLWGMACDRESGSPTMWIRLRQGEEPLRVRGRRGALLLAGVTIPRGHVAYQTPDCKSDLCVNPDHCRVGTKAEWGRFIAESGAGKTPAKLAANRKIGREKLAKITMEDAREIRVSNESTYALAKRYGIAQSAIWNIKRGRAWKELAPGASVFTLGYQETA